MTFRETITEDLRAARLVGEGESLSRIRLVYKLLWCILFDASVTCVFWYRVNHALHIRRQYRLAGLLTTWRKYRFANDISPSAVIGPGLYLPHLSDIVIGTRTVIGPRATIMNGVTIGTLSLFESKKKRPTLGSNVFIGTGAKVLGGITIGDGCTISALSLCTRDVPSGSIFFGIPPNHKIWTERA